MDHLAGEVGAGQHGDALDGAARLGAHDLAHAGVRPPLEALQQAEDHRRRAAPAHPTLPGSSGVTGQVRPAPRGRPRPGRRPGRQRQRCWPAARGRGGTRHCDASGSRPPRSAGLRPQRRTSWPASARTRAKAVPHEPSPMTAACISSSLRPVRPCSSSGRFRSHGAAGDSCAGCRSAAGRTRAGRRPMSAPTRRASVASSRLSCGHDRQSQQRESSVAHPGVQGRRELQGLPRQDADHRPAPHPWHAPVRRQEILRSPLRHRDHRAPGLPPDPCRTRLADHRPQVDVPGEGSLRIDHHALTATHGVHRSRQRRTGVLALPLHGDLPGCVQQTPEDRHVEQLGLSRETADIARRRRGSQRW